MQQAQVEEKRQQEANETALAAIGKPKKRKLEESTNHLHSTNAMSSNGPEQISSIQPSPSSGVVNSTTTNSKSVSVMMIINHDLVEIFRKQPNVSVERIFVIYCRLWNATNI